VTTLASSAPHLYRVTTDDADLADWGPQPEALEGASHSTGRLVHMGPGGRPEIGLWRCTPGRWRLALPADELCYFAKGRVTYRGDNGEVIEVGPDTAVHFKQGWSGEATVTEPITVTYILTEGGPSSATPVLRAASSAAPTTDWGIVPNLIEGGSRTEGILLSREPDKRAESGVWICTPGLWRCEVTSGEFCHFLSGRSTYVHDSGEVIQILPDTLAFFPTGWKGTCRVHETIRKVYMIQ
jgi:uncharacterized cupin superfamily protein